MPQHKSAEKRVRQTVTRTARNKAAKSKMKTIVKKVKASKDKASAATAYNDAAQILDRLATKGVIKKNAASNQKSKLAKHINKMK